MRVAVALAAVGDKTADFRREQIVPLSERDKNRAGRLRYLLPEIIPAFGLRHPLVELELHHEERLIDVVAQGCDAGIRLSKTVPGDIIGVRVGKPLRWIAVASPAYIEQRGRPEHPTDLMAYRCIRMDPIQRP